MTTQFGMVIPSPPSRQGRTSNSLSASDMALPPVIAGKKVYLRVSSIGVNSSAMFAFVLIVYIHFPTRPYMRPVLCCLWLCSGNF